MRCIIVVCGICMGVERAESLSQDELMPLAARVSQERLALLGQFMTWEQRERTWPLLVVGDLSRLFSVAIHHESTVVDLDGSPVDAPDRKYVFKNDMTLRDALEELTTTWPSQVRWTVVGKSVVVWQEPMEEKENLLNTPITLDIRDASLWGAIKALGEAITGQHDGLRQIVFSLPGMSLGYRPPSEFLVDGVIDYACENLPAREALCEILQDLPFLVRYTYYHLTSSEQPLALIIFWSSYYDTPEDLWGKTLPRESKLQRMMQREEILQWERQMRMGEVPAWVKKAEEALQKESNKRGQ